MFAEFFQSLRRAFQRETSDEVTIQPPLRPARTKLEPMRPHHRRTTEVREAVETAPAGLTLDQLTEFVRAKTGKGASRKLLVRLRRTAPAALIISALLYGACAQPQPATFSHTTTTPTPTARSSSDKQRDANTPRLLKVKLTITSADDLRVKVGDAVAAGAVLSDRHAERSRLLAQRRALAVSSQRIAAQIKAARQSVALVEQMGAQLPPVTFATEQAAIRRAEADAGIIARRAEVQRERLKVLPAVAPSGVDRGLIEAHETARGQVVEDMQTQAAAEVELAQAKFTAAREARAFSERQHRFEFARQMLVARNQQQQAEIARANLVAQIAALDGQLALLASVKAPFGGKVERIQWEEQSDEVLTVIVYLAVSDAGGVGAK